MDLYALGTLDAGAVVALSTRLPSGSTLQPNVTLVDSTGAAVADADGNATDGHFQGTILAAGAYYAQVQPTDAAQAGPSAQYLLDVSVTDSVAPQVTAVDPLPAEDGTTTAVVDRLTVTLSEDLNASTVAASAFDLREAGPDGVFGTADDVVYSLTPDPAYTTGATVSLDIQGGPLPSGTYRFTATPTLTDRAGNALDGNGDGTGGDAYVLTFQVVLPPGYVFEGPSNDTSATATALPLAEDPTGSGYFVGRGLGSVQSGTDQDWWSFQALAGDVVSVSVNASNSNLDPYVWVGDANGNQVGLGDNYDMGTNASVNITIPSSGTYYVQVTGYTLSDKGGYEVEVDLTRAIPLDQSNMAANANYPNSRIAPVTSGSGQLGQGATTPAAPLGAMASPPPARCGRSLHGPWRPCGVRQRNPPELRHANGQAFSRPCFRITAPATGAFGRRRGVGRGGPRRRRDAGRLLWGWCVPATARIPRRSPRECLGPRPWHGPPLNRRLKRHDQPGHPDRRKPRRRRTSGGMVVHGMGCRSLLAGRAFIRPARLIFGDTQGVPRADMIHHGPTTPNPVNRGRPSRPARRRAGWRPRRGTLSAGSSSPLPASYG